MDRNIIGLGLISLGAISGCQHQDNMDSRPNVIFILVDDLGWRDVGFMGSRTYLTPNLDSLSEDGMVFNQAYAACAVSSPTRASILTGKYPARLGITDWIRGRYSGVKIPYDSLNPSGFDTIPDRALLTPKNPFWMELEEITLAEILGSSGYVNAHIGKWHLGRSGGWGPIEQGFHYNFGGEDYGQPPSYFDPYKRNGFDIESLPGRKPDQYLTDRESEEAVRFIEQNRDVPFFLYLCHYAVHTPLQAKDVYTEEAHTHISELGLDPLSEDHFNQLVRDRQPLEGQRHPTYTAMIRSIDESTGKIVAALKRNHLYENTIIIFFSDNGGHIIATDNSPLRLGKGHPTEGGMRVPCLINYPGRIEANSVENTPIMSIDFMPTICSMIGIEDQELTTDGMDLTPLLEKDGKLPERSLFWHYPHYWWGKKVRPYSIVRRENLKLIKHWENDSIELYNLDVDVEERYNIAGQFPGVVNEISDELARWLESVDAKNPLPNPLFNGKTELN